MLVLIVIYVAGFFWLHPRRRNERKPPLVFYFWFLLGIFALLLPGLSYFFDYYRVPVAGILILFGALTARFFGRDHYFGVAPMQVQKSSVEAAIGHRREKVRVGTRNEVAVFACASYA